MLTSSYGSSGPAKPELLKAAEGSQSLASSAIPWALVGLGTVLLGTFVAARSVGDLLAQFPVFLFLFAVAFAAYLAACALTLQARAASRYNLVLVLAFAVAFRLVQVFAQPALSSDLYRYVWDARVQQAGMNPYLHAPGDPALAGLRDAGIYPNINRKEAISIYPPGGELFLKAIGLIAPDSLRGIQAAMAAGDVLALWLLVLLLRRYGLPAERVIVYAWSPLLVYELANNAHLEGVMLPFLVAALLAQQRGHRALAGICLGVATQIKIYPAVLIAVLWRRWDWRLPLAFLVVVLLGFLPYLDAGWQIFSYLPAYANEKFNMSLAAVGGGFVLLGLAQGWRVPRVIQILGLAVLGLRFVWRPSRSVETIMWRGLALIGWLIVWSQDVQPWYLLWVLPFLALLLRPGRWAGLGPAAVVAWLVLTGTVVLSYHQYWHQLGSGRLIILEYLPFYLLLALSTRERSALPD